MSRSLFFAALMLLGASLTVPGTAVAARGATAPVPRAGGTRKAAESAMARARACYTRTAKTSAAEAEWTYIGLLFARGVEQLQAEDADGAAQTFGQVVKLCRNYCEDHVPGAGDASGGNTSGGDAGAGETGAGGTAEETSPSRSAPGETAADASPTDETAPARDATASPVPVKTAKGGLQATARKAQAAADRAMRSFKQCSASLEETPARRAERVRIFTMYGVAAKALKQGKYGPAIQSFERVARTCTAAVARNCGATRRPAVRAAPAAEPEAPAVEPAAPAPAPGTPAADAAESTPAPASPAARPAEQPLAPAAPAAQPAESAPAPAADPDPAMPTR